MDKVDVIDEGTDEIYTDFFKCMDCGCENIMKGFNYCPNCGKKINRFLNRCYKVNYGKNDDEHIQCVLPSGHKGKCKGKNYDYEEIEWVDD